MYWKEQEVWVRLISNVIPPLCSCVILDNKNYPKLSLSKNQNKYYNPGSCCEEKKNEIVGHLPPSTKETSDNYQFPPFFSLSILVSNGHLR